MLPKNEPAAGRRPARDAVRGNELNVPRFTPAHTKNQAILPFEHIGSAANRAVLLAQLRLRSAELRQMTFAVDEVGIMLKSGHISPGGALHWMWTSGVDLVLVDVDHHHHEVAA